MKPIVDAGHVPGDLGDGQPAGRQGPRRRHGARSGTKIRAMKPWLEPGYDEVAGEGVHRLAAADERRSTRRRSASLRLLRLRVQLDGVRPGVPRAGGARQGLPLRRRRRATRPTSSGSSELQRGARDLGLHALLLLQRALPEGRRPARRDREARRRVDQGRASTATWARSTRSGSSPRRRRRAGCARPSSCPKTQGIVAAIKETKFALEPRAARQGAAAVPAARRRRTSTRRAALLRPRPGAGPRRRAGIVQGEQALAQIEHVPSADASCSREPHRARGGRRKGRRRVKVAYYKGCLAVALGEGARHLDAGARAEARARARGARVGHLLRRRRHPRGRARLLPAPERAHPRLRRGDRRGHADDDLQRLHAEPAAGELAAQERRRRCARASTRTSRRVGAPPYAGDVEVKHLLWLIAEGDGYERLKEVAHKGLKGLKVAPFYGCQILRPSKLLGFEDPDRPWSLEAIIEACGGEPIDYPAKIKCCGFPIIQAREETALGELIQPIEQAIEAGADAMVTPCPLCHLSLDAWQSKLRGATGKDFQMPILHLSQLIGVAAGLEESELKFKRHVVSGRRRSSRSSKSER